MPCEKKGCLNERAWRLIEKLSALTGRPKSYILSDAAELYYALWAKGLLYVAKQMAESGAPIIVNNNVVNNAPVYNINDLEVNLYAADIEMLRGVFQSILRDVERGVDLRTAVASRARALEKAARRIKTVDHPEVAQWRDAALKLLGLLSHKTAGEEALKLLKKYARQ
jgi:hypothetical protein